MLWFRSKKPAPTALPANPGAGVTGTVTFTSPEGRQWVEDFDVVRLAAAALKDRGNAVIKQKGWLEHRPSGFRLLPQIADFQLRDDGSVSTSTTVQIDHPTLAPGGIFEYQHATGDSIAAAVTSGFDTWVQTDFVTLLDALRVKPSHCTTIEMAFPIENGHPARVRRAVLGPVAHVRTRQPIDVAGSPEAEHAFCACCLLTRSMEAFKDLLESDRLCCLRLFAARDADGSAQADCRVNGEDYDTGARALREYVRTWPDAGVEFRKQYVVLHTLAAAAGQAGRAAAQ